MEKNAYRQRSRQAGSCRVRPEEWRFSLVDHPREHGWSIPNFDYKARIQPREEVDQKKGVNPMKFLIKIFTSAPLQKKKPNKPFKCTSPIFREQRKLTFQAIPSLKSARTQGEEIRNYHDQSRKKEDAKERFQTIKNREYINKKNLHYGNIWF